MSKFGLYSDKSATPFENHLEGLEEEIKASLLDLRNFVKSLGNNVIEEVRPHRVTYAKSLTYRTFLDIQPRKDSLISLPLNKPVMSDTALSSLSLLSKTTSLFLLSTKKKPKISSTSSLRLPNKSLAEH